MKFNTATLKGMFKFLKPHKKKFILISILMVTVAFIDSFFPYMTKYAIDNFIVPKNSDGILVFGIKYLSIVLFQGLIVFSFIYLGGEIKYEVSYEIREKAFEKLQDLSYSFYDKNSTGWLVARVTSDVEKVGEAVSWAIIDSIWGVTVTIFYIIMMFIIDLRLGIIGIAVLPFIIVVTYYFQTRILKYSRVSRKLNSQITSSYNEGIMGAKATKTLQREKSSLNEFKELSEEMNGINNKAGFYSSLYLPIIVSLGSLGVSIILWSGGGRLVEGTLTYGTLVAFMTYITMLFEPIKQLATVVSDFQRQYASMERVISLLDEELEIKDLGDKILDSFRGEIEFRDVDFKYKEGEKVLTNFNLKINAGETVAFVGETGSGKSTIVNLVCRFYEPTSGHIFIDGVDYRELDLNFLQRNLGYVLQKPHLFSGTIAENIAYGEPDTAIEKIMEAAKLVNAHEFIMKMENDYNTEVGEGGSRLSTGQKQLISFARAIIGNPKIFVLDEATSSIDAQTERLIQSAIAKVLEDRTSFIIAHRLSTIRKADKIIVIKKGEIIEGGTHKELMGKNGYYHNLYTKQFKEEKEEALLVND